MISGFISTVLVYPFTKFKLLGQKSGYVRFVIDQDVVIWTFWGGVGQGREFKLIEGTRGSQ